MPWFGSSPAVATVATPTVATNLAPGERYDTTLRPTCFGLPIKVTKEAAAKVGPENFKKYEYLLYIGAQLSRLAYCDSGIMWKVMENSLGMSNDVVNKVITAYDMKFAKEKTAPSKAPGSESGRPMESYSLTVSPSSENKYATYISTPDDLTCLVINASKINENEKNPNSILSPIDVFVSFKGSSSIKNFIHDLQSQITRGELGLMLAPIGVKVGMNDGNNWVTSAFINPIVNAWTTLMRTLSEHITADGTRLFLCGQSLGGAYCTLFAFILAEGKTSDTIPIMKKVKNIHILSYGSPTLLSDTARNTFNRHLESGLVTLDRVVSQRMPAVFAAATAVQGFTAGLGPNDIIPTLPAGFSHPGFRPLATNWYPEKNGRPYSMDNIRKFYGVTTNTRYRDPATWPFPENMNLGDSALEYIVYVLIGIKPPPPKKDIVAEAGITTTENSLQKGGLSLTNTMFGKQKTIYSSATQKHIPDFVSVAGSTYAWGFAHMEYLGMFFAGVPRLPGMKNPGYGNRTAVFTMNPSGIKLAYEDYTILTVAPKKANSQPVLGGPSTVINSLSKGNLNPVSDNGTSTLTATSGGYRTRRKIRNTKSARKMNKSRRR